MNVWESRGIQSGHRNLSVIAKAVSDIEGCPLSGVPCM